MAQEDIVNLTGASYCAIESTFGTTPSMTRIFPRAGGTLNTSKTIIPVDTLQSSMLMRDKSVRGLKQAQAQFTTDFWLDATRLTSGASPATTWLGAMLKALLGGESSAAGSTIAIGSTTSSIIAGGGHGSRFPVGTVFLSDVGDVPEVVISKAVATDTITPLFNLSASPTTGQDLVNCHNYYLTNTNTQALSFQHALAQDSDAQWTVNGCTGSVSMEIPRDGRLSFGFNLTGPKWTGPSDQSISVAAGTNALVGPMTSTGALMYLQTLGTTTRTSIPFHSVSLTINNGMSHVTEVGGTTEGITAAIRNGMPEVTAELTIRQDLARFTSWDSDEDLVLVCAIPYGSGATMRWYGFVLYCNIEGRPQRGNVDNREMTVLSLRSRHNTMQSAATTDLARSPFIVFEG